MKINEIQVGFKACVAEYNDDLRIYLQVILFAVLMLSVILSQVEMSTLSSLFVMLMVTASAKIIGALDKWDFPTYLDSWVLVSISEKFEWTDSDVSCTERPPYGFSAGCVSGGKIMHRRTH